MELRNVVIVANIWKDESHKVADEIKGYLEKHGIAADILLTENLDEKFDISIKTDLLVSVGGDGTVLFCARLVENLGIPILAVNLGTFGYITEISSTEWKQAIDDLLNGEEKISRRLMLKVSVHRDGKRIFQCQGLNEAVVTSAGVAKVVHEGFGGGGFIDNVIEIPWIYLGVFVFFDDPMVWHGIVVIGNGPNEVGDAVTEKGNDFVFFLVRVGEAFVLGQQAWIVLPLLFEYHGQLVFV